MTKKTTPVSDKPAGIHFAPWEKTFGKVLTPFEEFIHRQTTSGLLLMVTAVIALVLANGPYADEYRQIIKTYISIGVGDWGINMTMHHWINDALMVLFFFVVGLELKREFLVGELSNLRNAILPIAAAIGGMGVPALVYFAFNPTGYAANGWGIPMATDIAFAIGALALLASRVPRGLITFLVAVAIIDDLGAVTVIAIFYTDTINLTALAIASGLFLSLLALNLSGIRNTIPYFILALFLWYAFLVSGVHATLAGVLGALTVPAVPKYDPERLGQRLKGLMRKFDESYKPGENILTNEKLRGVVQNIASDINQAQAPLQRLEHIWHMPVAYLVIPIFALANAGIQIEFGEIRETLAHPVMLGVFFGLVFGKFVGITGMSWLVLKLGIADLPKDTKFSQIAGVSLIAGIGFTMSMFIAQLGLRADDEILLMAKTGILLGSFVAGVTGFVWLYIVSKPVTTDDKASTNDKASAEVLET